MLGAPIKDPRIVLTYRRYVAKIRDDYIFPKSSGFLGNDKFDYLFDWGPIRYRTSVASSVLLEEEEEEQRPTTPRQQKTFYYRITLHADASQCFISRIR